MTNFDDDGIRRFIREAVISDKVKAGLQKALELRGALQKTQREIAELQRQLDAIRNDQRPRMALPNSAMCGRNSRVVPCVPRFTFSSFRHFVTICGSMPHQ